MGIENKKLLGETKVVSVGGGGGGRMARSKSIN